MEKDSKTHKDIATLKNQIIDIKEDLGFLEKKID